MKLILMGSEQRIAEVRPAVERRFAGRASLTTAIPGMLEVLPLGASKGAGVAWLLDRLGVDPACVMALGDGENDVSAAAGGMRAQAACCMAGCRPQLAASWVIEGPGRPKPAI
jgi:hydroxymethylpyrimidine pyrophosphatase-like HAD family hydrolase